MARKPKAKVGAPAFEWTPEVETEILSAIMGGQSIMEICGPGRDSFLPSETTFYKRLSSDPQFAEKYARARTVQAHREFDEIRTISDTATPDNVTVARLQIDARKWRAGKLAPKVYGEKLDIDHSSTDGTMQPTQVLLVAAKRNDGS